MQAIYISNKNTPIRKALKAKRLLTSRARKALQAFEQSKINQSLIKKDYV